MTSSFIRKPKVGSIDPIDVSRIISFLDRESGETRQQKPVVEAVKKSENVTNPIEKSDVIEVSVQSEPIKKKTVRKVVNSKSKTLKPKFMPMKGDDITWL